MAYALKYILRYETAKYQRDVQLFIYAEGYDGPEIPKKIGASRIQLTKQTDGKISGTVLDFAIQADTDMEFVSFFSNNNKQHKVELQYNYKTVWSGYIISDQYSEPYIAPPYDVQVMCTDGLGLLKTENFELTGIISRFDAIRYCLDKIGFTFGYLINVDLWETTMDQSAHNMLDQIYFQAEIFAGKTCYETLQSILPEDVTITQEWGRWMIQRTADFNKYLYAFNNAGAFESKQTTQPVFDLGTIESGDIHPLGYLTMDFVPAWKNFVIKQNFGKKESLLNNYDFTLGTSSWSQSSAGLLKTIQLKSGTFGLIQGSTDEPDTMPYISQAIPLKSLSPITLEIKYSPVGYYRRTGSTNISVIQAQIYFQLILTGTTGTFYLNEKGWVDSTSAPASRYIYVQNAQTSQFYDEMKLLNLKLSASKLPEDGTLEFRAYQMVIYPENANNHVSGLAIQQVLIYATDLELFKDTEETKVIISQDATKEGETIELMPVDLPDYDNAQYFFNNGNYVLSGTDYIPAKLWGTNGVRYINYLAAFISSQYELPRSILKGSIAHNGVIVAGSTLVNSGFNLNARVTHPLTGKQYTVTSGTWYVLDDYFDVEMLELVPIDEDAIVEVPEEFNPRTEWDRHPEIADFVSLNPEIVLNWTRNAEGSYTHTLPGSSIPAVVERKDTIDAFKLDPASGQPQFSLREALIETNVDGNANKIKVGAGAIISHHFNALSRTDRRILEQAAEPYDPTREWTINEETITLPNNNQHFIYIKVATEPDTEV